MQAELKKHETSEKLVAAYCMHSEAFKAAFGVIFYIMSNLLSRRSCYYMYTGISQYPNGLCPVPFAPNS